MHVSSASIACTSAGPMTLGSSTPLRLGPITARRSLSVWPVDGGCTLAKITGRPASAPSPSSSSRTIRRVFSRSPSGNGVRGSSRSITIESAPDASARSIPSRS